MMKQKSKLLLALFASVSVLAGCSSVDLNPNPDQAQAQAEAARLQALLNQRQVFFGFDSYSVPSDAQAMIEAHAAYMNAHPSATVVLEGNTDERGGREYNLALGQKRSDAVKARLQLLGVPAERLESVSFGKERPLDAGHDEAAWSQNRRVDIKYLSN